MSPSRRKWLYLVRETGLVICGVILALVPLALWAAWSKSVMYIVLTVCLTTVALVIALAQIEVADDEVPPTNGSHDT